MAPQNSLINPIEYNILYELIILLIVQRGKIVQNAFILSYNEQHKR